MDTKGIERDSGSSNWRVLHQALFFSNASHLHYKETALSGTVEQNQTEGDSDMGITKFIGYRPVSLNRKNIA